MRYRLARLLALLSLAASLALPAAAAAKTKPAPTKPLLGDLDAEFRRPDGHVDAPATIAALKAMSANTYFYLVWHAQTDWDDLPAFADLAAREGIDIWVYLIPWSETPLAKKSWGFSEPYRVDYVRWAREIAKLSLEHKNVVGYVIDDFYPNSTQPDRFTVPYVRRMLAAGRDVNPDLKFYPLLYFHQPWADFMDRFGDLVDGVVVCYPKSRVQIGNALAYLNGRPHGASAIFGLPKSKPSRESATATISTTLHVSNPAIATVSFFWDDTDVSPERDVHTAFVRVDGRTVWRGDAAANGTHVAGVDLSHLVRRGDRVRIELGVEETRRVERARPVTVRIDDIQLIGFDTLSEMASDRLFTPRANGGLKIDLAPASPDGDRRRPLPMILMPAGPAEQHEKRYTTPPTAANIADKVEMCLNLVRDGRAQGVVTYNLPKDADDPIYQAVRAEYRRAADALSRPPAAAAAGDEATERRRR